LKRSPLHILRDFLHITEFIGFSKDIAHVLVGQRALCSIPSGQMCCGKSSEDSQISRVEIIEGTSYLGSRNQFER